MQKVKKNKLKHNNIGFDEAEDYMKRLLLAPLIVSN